MSGELRHGRPDASRNDKWEHDKHTWPDGLSVFVYDDGRVKVERWDATVVVEDCHSYPPGRSGRANAHVEVRFTPDVSQDQDQEEGSR